MINIVANDPAQFDTDKIIKAVVSNQNYINLIGRGFFLKSHGDLDLLIDALEKQWKIITNFSNSPDAVENKWSYGLYDTNNAISYLKYKRDGDHFMVTDLKYTDWYSAKQRILREMSKFGSD